MALGTTRNDLDDQLARDLGFGEATVKLPEDVEKLPIFIVKHSSPAWAALERIFGNKPRPGTFYPVSNEEFVALKTDILGIKAE